MMGAMSARTLLSGAEFEQLPEEEGHRYELLDGEIMEAASATAEHSFIQMELGAELRGFLRASGGVCLPEIEFRVGPNTRLRPDLAVLRAETWARVDQTTVPVAVMPEIAIEIVSPSEHALKLDRKVAAYLEAGVAEVWVIYPNTRHVQKHIGEVIQNVPESGMLETPLLPGWTFPVQALFPTRSR
jgi:Uma2 family endonuclease